MSIRIICLIKDILTQHQQLTLEYIKHLMIRFLSTSFFLDKDRASYFLSSIQEWQSLIVLINWCSQKWTKVKII